MGNNTSNIKLKISCFKATELIDKRSVLKLSTRENIQLVLHKCICKACREYEKQSTFLNHLLDQHIQKTNFSNVQSITNNELKINIINKLNQEN